MTSKEECHLAYESFRRDRVIYNLPYKTPPPPEDITKIANYGKSYKDRTFPYHDFKKFKNLEALYFSTDDSTSISVQEEYLDFVDKEWDRRYEGFWFFNGNNLEYITGKNYIFLQWWLITVEKNGRNRQTNPTFVDAQRDVFYAWDFCQEDKNSFGLVLGSGRRYGKTAIASCIGFLDTTENSDSNMAIQSKTESDAKGIFMKIIKSWQKLPQFLKPIDTGETKVQRRLVFDQPKTSSKDVTKIKEYIDVLGSEIWYESSKELALDGAYCSFIYNDETGKTPDIDVNVRWNVQKECLSRGSKIIGKSFMTTTVEDMEKKGGANFKKVWDRSNYADADKETMQTSSGLYRLFIPADYGYMGHHPKTGEPFVDEFGYSNRAAAKMYIEQKIAQLNGSDKIEYRRKYPLYEDDMFLIDSSESPFTLHNLYTQRKYNDEEDVSRLLRRGNLYWAVKDVEVKFVDDPDNGKWLIYGMPSKDDRNRFVNRDGVKFPARTTYRMGVDPVDDRTPTSGKGSDYVAYVAAMPTPEHGNSAPIPVCEYQNRVKNPEEMWEDMVLTAVFYSAYINPEQNKGGTATWFGVRGFEGFTMYDPYDKDAFKKQKKGTPNNGHEVRTQLINDTAVYVAEHVGYLGESDCYADFVFNRLIEDLIIFDKMNWTPHDNTVAWMMTLAACKAKIYHSMVIDTPNNIIDDLVKKRPIAKSKWQN